MIENSDSNLFQYKKKQPCKGTNASSVTSHHHHHHHHRDTKHTTHLAISFLHVSCIPRPKTGTKKKELKLSAHACGLGV